VLTSTHITGLSKLKDDATEAKKRQKQTNNQKLDAMIWQCIFIATRFISQMRITDAWENCHFALHTGANQCVCYLQQYSWLEDKERWSMSRVRWYWHLRQRRRRHSLLDRKVTYSMLNGMSQCQDWSKYGFKPKTLSATGEDDGQPYTVD